MEQETGFSQIYSFSRDERKNIQPQIDTLRSDYNTRQAEVKVDIQKNETLLVEQNEKIEIVAREVEALRTSLQEKKNSTLAKLLGFFKLDQSIDPRVKKASESFKTGELGQIETFNLAHSLNEQLTQLRQVEEDRHELDEAENVLGEFWRNQSEAWKSHEKDEQVRDVTNMCLTNNCALVHAIHPSFIPSNNSLLNPGTSWQEKFKILLALEPVVASSTVHEGDDGNANLWCKMGVIVGGGRIQSAFPHDAATMATGIKDRDDHTDKQTGTDLNNQISKAIDDRGNGYNEIVVQDPEYAGFFVCLDSSTNPYEDASKTMADITEITKMTQEFNIPLYAMKKGKFYQTTINGDGGIGVGEETALASLVNSRYDIDGRREDVIESILDGAPIKKERVANVEANLVNCQQSGREYYWLLKAKQLISSGEIANRETTPYHRETKNGMSEGGSQFVEGAPVISLGEVLKGKEKSQFFISSSTFFDPQINENRTDHYLNSRKWEKDGRVVVGLEYSSDNDKGIKNDSINSIGLIAEGKIQTVDDLIAQTKKSIDEEIKIRDEHWQKYKNESWFSDDSERINNAIFHLYGVGEEAGKNGDLETQTKVFEAANQLYPKDKYQEIISKRLDEQGNFHLTREELGLIG
jgi:hypothetical protein